VSEDSRATDRALWITWYDLPDAGREAYLAWLHDTWLPALLGRRGYLWAAHYEAVRAGAARVMRREATLKRVDDPAVPAGSRYLLLVGAEHGNVFGDPAPGTLRAALPEGDRKMLAMRQGERTNMMVEAARVQGPAARDYPDGMALAPCIQLGSFNCAWQHEEDMLAWYAQVRMPAMTALPGCVRARKLASVSGWAKHAILYEFVSLEARDRHFAGHDDRHSETSAWGDRVVATLIHAPGSSTTACRIWP
jgi:hypothetical protein